MDPKAGLPGLEGIYHGDAVGYPVSGSKTASRCVRGRSGGAGRRAGTDTLDT